MKCLTGPAAYHCSVASADFNTHMRLVHEQRNDTRAAQASDEEVNPNDQTAVPKTPRQGTKEIGNGKTASTAN